RWQKIFKSRLVGLAVAYGNTVFIVLIVILVLLLFGGCRQRPGVGGGWGWSPGTPDPVSRSLLRRLVTLISQQAVLGASSEAFRKQAEGASQAARRYM
ncbi:BAP31 protein, partial [Chloroceryle aenea]|nr:BAP31 protein [Chloroceryle aenea]